MKIKRPTFDSIVLVAVAGAGILGVFLLYWLLGANSIVITNIPDTGTPPPVSALSGLPCERQDRRPVAVMLASDAEARPLSGVGQADIVFEMPVTPNGITRLMAVYQCNEPKEIGSIRSVRSDFIPLAQGVDAILAHWGGEHDALASLNGGLMDNVDALKYEGSTYYRKIGTPRPHNGFTTLQLIQDRAHLLGYRSTTSLDPYLRTSAPQERNLGSLADEIRMPWTAGMEVTFIYDSVTNTYLRQRGGKPEIDVANYSQASASVVVVVQTTSSFLRDQYIRVKTIGSGEATIWQGGQRINAHWKKDHATDPLLFTDSHGDPIKLIPGTIWVLFNAPLPTT